MKIFALVFFFVGLVMAAMAIGLIVRQRPLKGTCASLSNLEILGEQGECTICGRSADELKDCSGDESGEKFYRAD